MSYLIIVISAILVNNIVLMQFLGICPFLGVSKRVSTAIGMAEAVAFVLVLATLFTYLIHHYIINNIKKTHCALFRKKLYPIHLVHLIYLPHDLTAHLDQLDLCCDS